MLEVHDLHAERMRRLGRANEIRTTGRKVKEEIGELGHLDGLGHVATLLEQDDPRLGSLSVRQLVKAIYRMGDAQVTRIIARAGIVTRDRKVAELSDRQRVALADALRVKAAAYYHGKAA